MKKSVNRKKRKKKTSWWCSNCKTEFKNKKDAVKCSKMPRLDPEFKVGENVFLSHPMFCDKIMRDALDAFYVGKGTVVAIKGPYPPDKEYIQEYFPLDSYLLCTHYYLYLVSHKCPYCKGMESHIWHGLELKKQS